MKIVVCVKHVPDATASRRFDESDHTVDRAGVDGLLSELDEYAVEEALRIRDAADDGGEVMVLTMGREQAADAIRRSLQMGADAGAHVLDESIAGSDALATSQVLASAVQRIGGWDLVLCGMASTDGSMGVVPAMLAERLGVPQVTYAAEVSVDGTAGAYTVTARRDSDLATETIEAQAPLVVSVTDQINEPRYPSFKQIMAAKKKPVDTWSLADLGIDASQIGLAAAWSVVASVEARPPRSQGEVVSDEGDGGIRLAGYLADQKFI